MLCPNCGESINENVDFCPNCGTKLNREPQAPAAQTPAFAQADFQATPKKKKMTKKKLGVTLATIGVLLAAIAIAAIIFWPQVSGFFVKTFGSPEAYFQHVEKQTVADAADSVSQYYGLLLDNFEGTSGTGTMQLQVSDKLLELAGLSDMNMNIDWVNDITLKYETVNDGPRMLMKMILAVSGKDVADLSMIMDTTTGYAYIALPSLSDEYLQVSMNGDDIFVGGASSGLATMMYDPDFLDALPNEKAINQLLTKYLQLIVENTSSVKKESDTISVGGIEQKVTVLEYKLTERGLMKIVKAVLKEAKNDKDLKRVIVNIAKYMEKQGALSDADEVYDSFKAAVEMALSSMDGAETTSSEPILVLTDYVNSASEVVGRKLTVDGETILKYVTATKGKDFATKVELGGAAVLSGKGTISGDVREGKYTLEVMGEEYLNLYVKYDEKKLEEGTIDGVFRLTPAATLLDSMGMDSQTKSLISSMELGLELVISADGKTSSMAVNLLSKNDVLLGLSGTGKVSGGKDVTIPENYVREYNADDWAESLDFGKIVDALEQTSVPKELVDLLEDAIDSLNDPYYYYY